MNSINHAWSNAAPSWHRRSGWHWRLRVSTLPKLQPKPEELTTRLVLLPGTPGISGQESVIGIILSSCSSRSH